MQRIMARLHDRAQRLQAEPGAGVDLGFLNQLTAALDEWLKEVEAEAEASVASSNFELGWLARNPVPPTERWFARLLCNKPAHTKRNGKECLIEGWRSPSLLELT